MTGDSIPSITLPIVNQAGKNKAPPKVVFCALKDASKDQCHCVVV